MAKKMLKKGTAQDANYKIQTPISDKYNSLHISRTEDTTSKYEGALG